MAYKNTDITLESFPSPFQRAIEHDSYDGGHSKFSVTTLISPPQRTYLKTLGEERRSPYSMFTALLGTAMHSIIEAHVDESAGEIAEKRLYANFEVDGETISVSGQVDHIENQTVSDYKLTGGVQDKMKQPHLLQANMNAYLAEENGIKIGMVSVIYVQKDWSHLRSTVDPNYPNTPFRCFTQPYDSELALRTFQTTVQDHERAARGQPRSCTPDEQWRSPTTYALKKVGGKKASKVCSSMAEAEQLKKPGQFIEVRPGEATYCNNFCGFSHLCPQFKREQQLDNTRTEP